MIQLPYQKIMSDFMKANYKKHRVYNYKLVLEIHLLKFIFFNNKIVILALESRLLC